MKPPYTRDALIEQVAAGLRPKFVFFWGHTGRGGAVGKECFSQWYPSPFDVGGIRYPTAEHWMMAEKARLFGDDDALAEIVAADSPGAAKALGRKVRGFDDDTWRAHRVSIVVAGNRVKFAGALGAVLRQTGDRVLVEASPRDRIWGIGLGAKNPDAERPAAWRGDNLLGFALMTVRDQLG